MDEIKNNIHFDRVFWPETEAKIPDTPPAGYDLHSLWNDYPDQASVFIAESLMEESHFSYAVFHNGEPYIATPIWNVGGDVLTIKEPLIDLIKDGYDDYGIIRSEAQAKDVRGRIVNLGKIEKTIFECKQLLNKQLVDGGYSLTQEK